MDRGAWQATVCGVSKSWTRLSDFHFSSVVSASAVSLASIAGVIQIGFFPTTVQVEILASSLFLYLCQWRPWPFRNVEMLTSLTMTLLFLFITFLPLKWSEVKSLSHVQLFVIPWTVAHQAPLSIGFSRQEYWSGLPFPSPGDGPNSGLEPGSPAFQADALTSENISPGTTESSRTLKTQSSVLVVCANPLNGSLSENRSLYVKSNRAFMSVKPLPLRLLPHRLSLT